MLSACGNHHLIYNTVRSLNLTEPATSSSSSSKENDDWKENAKGRIQGCFDFFILIECPLKRSKRTVDVIWESRKEEILTDSDLREIDVYSFQFTQNNLLQRLFILNVHWYRISKKRAKTKTIRQNRARERKEREATVKIKAKSKSQSQQKSTPKKSKSKAEPISKKC
ncbi:hypothetical protein Tco_1429322 [Tanacetum coccineum]